MQLRARWMFWAALYLSVQGRVHLAAQAPPAVEVKPFAEVCRFDRRVRLPVDDGTQLPTYIGSVTIDQFGRMYLTDAGGEHAFVTDSMGRPIQRIGRRGQGPGEFQLIRQVHRARSGRLYVLDQVGMTIGILDSTGRELRRVPTRGVGGRRMVLQDDSIPVVSGHYRDEHQVVAYALDGTVLWAKAALPGLLKRLRPRLDLSFIAALPRGGFIAGSGLVPELWAVSAKDETRIPLDLQGRWQQLEPYVGSRDRAALQAWLSRGTLIGEAVAVGASTIAFGFGRDLALLNVLQRRMWILRDAPGSPAASANSRILLTLPQGEAENTLAWYACRGP